MKIVSKLFMHANGGLGLFWIFLMLAKWDITYSIMATINLAVALLFYKLLTRHP